MKFNIKLMSGAGNLFSVIDGRDFYDKKINWGNLASEFCNLQIQNIPRTEGLMVINSSNSNDFEVEFYNPDGSSGMMCGNGGRCAVRFAENFDFIKNSTSKINFIMANTVYNAQINNDLITLNLPKPNSVDLLSTVTIDGKSINGTYINVGSDHFVIDFDSLDENVEFNDFDLVNFGRKIRYHEKFMPRGVNCNIFKRINESEFFIRTYERGVENETGACGTGTISTALKIFLENDFKLPYYFIPTSKQRLSVNIKINSDKIIEYFELTGSADFIGEIVLDKTL